MRGPYGVRCTVYFVQVRGGGPIKIGGSQSILKRLEGLQAWSPFPLDLVAHYKGGFFDESMLHEMQRDFRIHGEWFEPNPALLEIIEHVKKRKALPAPIKSEIARLWSVRVKAEQDKNQRALDREKRRAEAVLKKSTHVKTGWTDESRRKFAASRAASDARRKAAQGNGRAYDFQIVATPKGAQEQ